MTIECYEVDCPRHGIHQGQEGPFCDEKVCIHVIAEKIAKMRRDKDDLSPEELDFNS